ncbi:FAD-binding oxidoreductase [Hydrogenophaga sp. 5NK40-0174]|uniref:FAD-binding oxidoreductase n=1 Tax=Hydrogenophaga sp. 5NK40-0174 TaxID=3127649 RepID=UPI00310463B9
MSQDNRDLLTALRACVGDTHVLTRDRHANDMAAFEQDWRKRAKGEALAVVCPASVDEVAAVLRACQTHRASVVPQGGNTGLVVGSVPDTSGQQVVLSLKRLNKIRAIDAANLTCTVDAGCILQNVQEAAAEAGLLFPLSLAAEGSCTIGGNLSTNAGGTQVLRYGNARDLCLGLEVVTAQGEIWNGLSGLRKDNTGYDLRDLFIGSEGTLGVITGATLKLYPQPVARLTAWAAVPGLEKASELLGMAHQNLSASLTGFEVMNQFSLSLVDKHFPQLHVPFWQQTPWCVLLEISDAESETHARERFEHLLESALAAEVLTDAVVAQNIAHARQFWHIRESIPLAQAEEGLNIKHDISVPVSAIADFCAATDRALQTYMAGIRLVNFGHLGDGNLHYNVQAPEGGDAADFLISHEKRINELVFNAVVQFGGSISAEHGIGSLKASTLPRYKDKVALDLMRAIKQSLDPQGILNPGRVLA